MIVKIYKYCENIESDVTELSRPGNAYLKCVLDNQSHDCLSKYKSF